MMLMASPNSGSAIPITTLMGEPKGINVLRNFTLKGCKHSPNLCKRLRSLRVFPQPNDLPLEENKLLTKFTPSKPSSGESMFKGKGEC